MASVPLLPFLHPLPFPRSSSLRQLSRQIPQTIHHCRKGSPSHYTPDSFSTNTSHSHPHHRYSSLPPLSPTAPTTTRIASNIYPKNRSASLPRPPHRLPRATNLPSRQTGWESASDAYTEDTRGCGYVEGGAAGGAGVGEGEGGRQSVDGAYYCEGR